MNISYSRYAAFVKNPERYRLHYGLGLTPDDDETPTMMNFGRRRGSCFHALAEKRGDSENRARCAAVYGEDLVSRAEDMLAVVPDLGDLFLVEHSFEVSIGDGKHSIVGRIDHGFSYNGSDRIGDFKTTKGTRTKKEVSEYLAEMTTSPQSHFYLKAAAALGHPTDTFTYHVVFDRKDKKSNPKYLPVDIIVGPAEVNRTMTEVYAACETIDFLTNKYGVEKPWPHSNCWPCLGDRFMCGYQGLCGRTLPKGVEPPGFTNRYRDLIEIETETEVV